MLNRDQATERAWAIIREKGINVCGLDSIHKIDAAFLPPRYSAKGDVWIARFALPTNPDVDDTPNHVLVEVLDSTGETVIADSL